MNATPTLRRSARSASPSLPRESVNQIVKHVENIPPSHRTYRQAEDIRYQHRARRNDKHGLQALSVRIPRGALETRGKLPHQIKRMANIRNDLLKLSGSRIVCDISTRPHVRAICTGKKYKLI